MDDKRIKLINKKLFLCLILAAVFYLIGVTHTVMVYPYNHTMFYLFILSFILLCVSFVVGNFTKGYVPAFFMGTCFVITTLATALIYNSCLILAYLTVILAIISIYQNFYLMTYISILTLVATAIGEVMGCGILGWNFNESGLLPFILITNILGVFLSYRQIKKDNKVKYDELENKQNEVEAAYRNIIELSKVVSESASQLVSKATGNRNDTQMVLESINEIVNALGSQSESICKQAESSSRIQSKLEDVQEYVHKMDKQVDTVIGITSKNEESMLTLNKNTEMVNDIAESSQNSITELYKQVTQVQSVVDIITSVAEQTNLLSLNANIEAAKAGAFGSGFTVVAAEIRKLSDSTTESVQQINSMLHSLHKKTEKVNSEIQQMNTAFNTQKQEIENTNNNINELLTSMNSLKSGLANMIISTDDVVSSNNAVTESITNLSSISEEISATIDTVGTACKGVLESSNDTLMIAEDVDNKVKELSV